ncbi:Putative polysaccharide biosynthesis protein [Candidatus Arthromitus sp. SFB-3]|nr:Putative polysaccharide biosynthesis protein [Candidatus Arthromitus sp. SFB-3]
MSVDFKKLFNNKIIKNFVIVFLGDGFSSILTLLNLSIMIRVLGLNGSSNVNLAISYVLVFDAIFNFQSFNSIIKFLPQYIISNNIRKIRQYIQQGFVLDIITSIISFIFCNLFIVIMFYIFNLDKGLIKLINIYSFSILFNLTGTSIGIIRVFDKFKYSSYINVVVNLFKFIFYVLSFFIKSSMLYFIWVELIFSIVSMVFIFTVTKYILNIKNIKNIFKIGIKWDNEFLKFNFYCNFMTTLDVPMSHLTPFLINRFIGIEFISVYKVIEKIGGIIAKIASPLVNIIYPEISTKISEGDIYSSLNLVKKLFFI